MWCAPSTPCRKICATRGITWKKGQDRTKELSEALANVKTLKGLLPICASCKKIRDDRGYWTQIESYLYKHSDAEFTHGICPDCSIKLYPVETTPDQEPD